MTKYRFSEGAAIVFGGSGGLGTGIVNLLAESGSDVAFSYHKNKESAEKNLSGIEKIGRSGLIAGVDLLDMKNVQNFVNDAKEIWPYSFCYFCNRTFLTYYACIRSQT